MRKAEYGKNRSIKYILVSVVAVLLIAAILLALAVWDRQYGLFPEADKGGEVMKYKGTEYVLKDNVDTFLVLGLDKFEEAVETDSYKNDQQADFLMLMVFDNDEKTYSSIHINRDTMAEIEVLGLSGSKVGTVTKQIALAHTYGKGGDISNINTAKAVSKLLYGIKVNHYMSLTLDSVAIMNDLVGGVEIEVLDDFSSIDETLIKGEKVLLEGEKALTYVRTRKGLEDSTNTTRMNRQQQYLDALREKIEFCVGNDSEFIAKAAVKMADYMVTDCTSARLQDIGKKMQEYEFVQINNIEGESRMGEKYIEFYPDKDSLKQVVIDLFYVPKD